MSTEGSPVDRARGEYSADDLRFCVLVSRFNAEVTDRLLEGALGCLKEHGAADDHVDVVRVPGAWELPQTAARVVHQGRHDAVIALGCVIRGETPHFDYVCSEASSGLGEVARAAPMPVLFGVLTTDDRAQADARSAAGKDNKGYECALAAIEMVYVYRELDQR